MKLWPSTCERVRDRGSAFLDGRLAAAARADVQQHLHACSACMLELQQLARLSRAMHNLPPFRLADGMAPRLRRRLAAAPIASATRPRRGFARRAAALAAATTAAAIVFWLGFLFGRSGTAPDRTPSPAAAPQAAPAPPVAAPPAESAQRLQPREAPETAPRRATAPNARFANLPAQAPPARQHRDAPDARQLLDQMLREMFGDGQHEPPRR